MARVPLACVCTSRAFAHVAACVCVASPACGDTNCPFPASRPGPFGFAVLSVLSGGHGGRAVARDWRRAFQQEPEKLSSSPSVAGVAADPGDRRGQCSHGQQTGGLHPRAGIPLVRCPGARVRLLSPETCTRLRGPCGLRFTCSASRRGCVHCHIPRLVISDVAAGRVHTCGQ